MDFARVTLSSDGQDFVDEVRAFLRTHVTDENLDEGVHLALGAQGYLSGAFTSEADVGSDVATCTTRAVRDGDLLVAAACS